MFHSSLRIPALLVALLGCGSLAAAQPTPAEHSAAAKPQAQRAKAGTKAKVQAVEAVALPALSPEQLAIANRVALGIMPCELSAHVVLRPDSRGAGRFLLQLGKQHYSMVPVATRTGAIRLEDEAAGVVWLQLANKSMLMSQKLGKRLADACVSADQLVVARELERNPAPSLLDAPAQSAGEGATAPTVRAALAPTEAQ